MRSLTVFDDADQLAAAAAKLVADHIRRAATTRLVLAGGSTPKRCYLILEAMDVPWGRVSILFGDERCVEPWHEDSNYRMARETLLREIHPLSVFRMPAELGPAQAAALYEPIVAVAPLDLVLLGIGPDGHTASLFPGDPALEATGYVAGVWAASKPPPERVTLTLRALREATRVVILAAGVDKAGAVRRAKAGEVPAGMIDHAEWLVTSDAAGGGGTLRPTA